MKPAWTAIPSARSASWARSLSATVAPLATRLSSSSVGNSKPMKAASRPERAPGAEELGVLEDTGRAGPGEVALRDAAPRQRLGQLGREALVDEVLVVAEVDVAGLERRDLVGHDGDRTRQVPAAAEGRDDAEGALHPAAPRGADHRHRRVDRGPVGGVLADPDGVVAPRVPQVAPGPRQGRRVGEERPAGALGRARDGDLGDPVEGGAGRSPLDDRPERRASLAAHDGVERRRVVARSPRGRRSRGGRRPRSGPPGARPAPRAPAASRRRPRGCRR